MPQSDTFTTYSESQFLNLMEKKSYLIIENGEYTENPDVDLTDFESQFRYVAWMVQSRWDHERDDTTEFFRGRFKWAVATKGSDKKITAISLIRFPDTVHSDGEIVYLEAASSVNLSLLRKLHEETSKVAGTWHEDMIAQYDIKLWKESLNRQFLYLLGEGTLN